MREKMCSEDVRSEAFKFVYIYINRRLRPEARGQQHSAESFRGMTEYQHI